MKISAKKFRECNYSHTGTYTKVLSGLDNIAYMLTYWLKSGTTWSLQTAAVPTITGGAYTISINTNGASTQVDDIRFYPASAQMGTYTYSPVVGVTSTTDAKNEITYYEYDPFQRLVNVKDKDGNIVKHTSYHYQGH